MHGLIESINICITSFLDSGPTRYSALLIGSRWDDLIIAAGTVFNQVVMWKPSDLGTLQRCAVHKRFSGHQVFGKKFS